MSSSDGRDPATPSPAAAPAEEAAPDATVSTLETFLPQSSPTQRAAAPPPAPTPALGGLRTARLMMVARNEAEILFAGDHAPRRARLDADVDHEVVQEAFETGDRVLVEPDEAGEPVIVGVVRARKPDTLKISARKVEIEGDEEVLFRSGRGAMRIREDGDVELVGSRISAASRGLFRLVGRMLRLN